jgi:hypothetical protein
MHHVYDIAISEDGGDDYLVVNLDPKRGGPTERQEALIFATAEAARIGWTRTRITRVAQTPSGGYSISIARIL